MKYAALIVLALFAAAPARAGLREWPRQPVCPADYAEIRRVAGLNPLSRCQLGAEIERQRDAYNATIMPRYRRMTPATGSPGLIRPGR